MRVYIIITPPSPHSHPSLSTIPSSPAQPPPSQISISTSLPSTKHQGNDPRLLPMMCAAAADDDDVQWKAEALNNPILAAAELYFFARPSERIAWRSRLPGDERLVPERWGRRGLRTKAAAAEKEEEAWSPNTPLSWSGAGSASSSGGGEKRRKVVGTGGAAPPPGGSVIKATTQVMDDPAAVGSTVAAKRRQGRRKMTLAELRNCERSLLDTKKELKKEVEEQRTAHRLLLEENERLRNSRTELHHHRSVQGSNKGCAVAEANVKKQRCLPFDLNMSLLDEFDDAAC